MKKILCLVMALAMLSGVAALAEGSDGDTVIIGGIAPLTGEAMLYGQLVKEGVDLYIDEVNANGGLLGKQVQINWLDDTHDATTAVLAYGDLVSAGMVALIGPVTTTPTKAVATRAAQDNMPMISASATAYEITDAGNNVFRACFLDPFQAKLMAQFASQTLEAKNVAVIYDNTNDYSIGLYEAFVAEAESLGMTVVAAESATADNADFTPQLIKIADQEPDAVFVCYYYEAAALILRQAVDVGLESAMLGADGWTGIADQLTDVPELLNNAYYCDSFSADDESPTVAAFVAAFTEKYGTAPQGFNALGYDAAKIMLSAIEAAGSFEADAIIAALDATDLDCVTGHITFDDHNDPIKSAFVMGFEAGAPTLVTRVDP